MGILSHFIIGILAFLDNILKPLIRLGFKFYYSSIDKLKPLPKCKSDLLLTPAHKLAQKIRKREITSLQLVETYIQRIKEVQPLVNCVVKECFNEAIDVNLKN